MKKILKLNLMMIKELYMLFQNLMNQSLHIVLQFIKLNGSEFDVVIMVVPYVSNMLLTRNLLYTGMTRARKLLIVISNSRIIDIMINNTDVKKRNTGLLYKLN